MVDEVTGIARAAELKDWLTVQTLQSRLNSTLNVLLRFPFLAALKAACRLRYNLDFGSVLNGHTFKDSDQEGEFLRQLAENGAV